MLPCYGTDVPSRGLLPASRICATSQPRNPAPGALLDAPALRAPRVTRCLRDLPAAAPQNAPRIGAAGGCRKQDRHGGAQPAPKEEGDDGEEGAAGPGQPQALGLHSSSRSLGAAGGAQGCLPLTPASTPLREAGGSCGHPAAVGTMLPPWAQEGPWFHDGHG